MFVDTIAALFRRIPCHGPVLHFPTFQLHQQELVLSSFLQTEVVFDALAGPRAERAGREGRSK